MLVLLPKIVTTSQPPFSMKRFSLTVLSAALLLFMVACSVSPVKKSLPVVEKKAEAKLETKVDTKTEPKNETKAETNAQS